MSESRPVAVPARRVRAVTPEIVVVGSLNRDVTVEVARLPAAGETVLGSAHRWDSGGKGANQAVAAARVGRSAAMVGRVGDDDAGTALVAAVEAEGVDASGVGRDPVAGTGLAVIVVDGEGENQIVVSPGANARLKPADLPADRLRSAAVVLMQLEVPVQTVVAAARLAGGTVVLNPAPAANLPPELLDRVDVLVPNRGELARLTGGELAAEMGMVAGQAGELPGDVVVTLGAAGALVVTGGEATHVPAPVVDAVDATAAGDAFCGALVDGLVRGRDLVGATRRAVAAGAVAASRRGAQSSLPTRADVEAMLSR